MFSPILQIHGILKSCFFSLNHAQHTGVTYDYLIPRFWIRRIDLRTVPYFIVDILTGPRMNQIEHSSVHFYF